MPHKGIPALKKIFAGLPPGRNIQLVGLEDAKMTEIALNILKYAKSPVFFNMNGMLNKKMAQNLTGDILTYDNNDGREAMDILRYIVADNIADFVVFDDIPAILSREEREGRGNEIESLEMISRTMLKIKTSCVKKGITIIWINQLREVGQGDARIWGGNYISRKMQMTLWCAIGGPISRHGKLQGYEVGVKVIKARSEFANRRTYFGIFQDGSIDYNYWLFKEAQRYKLITYEPISKEKRHTFFYDGKQYNDRWKIVDKIKDSSDFEKQILEQIEDAEKKKSLY